MAAEAAVPGETLPHIQILQLGHCLLGQDRQWAQDVSIVFKKRRNTETEAPTSPTNAHKRKEVDRVKLLICSKLLAQFCQTTSTAWGFFIIYTEPIPRLGKIKLLVVVYKCVLHVSVHTIETQPKTAP